MVLTVRGIVSFLAMLFAGVFYRKLGLRLGMAASLMLAAVAFLFFVVGNGRPVIYYMAGAVGGIAYAYGVMLPASMLLKNWFNKSRGFAFSIASAGTALTSLIGAPILQRMINGFGLYTTFLAEAGFLFLVAVLIFCIVREKPETMGLKPYGGDIFIPDRGIKTKDVPTIPLNRGWIYAVFVAALLLNFGASPASAHLSLNFTTVGLDSMSAAKAISLYGAGLLFFKLIYGKTVDRVGSCISTLIFGLLVALGYAMCGAAVWFPNNAWMFTSPADPVLRDSNSYTWVSGMGFGYGFGCRLCKDIETFPDSVSAGRCDRSSDPRGPG